MFCGPSCLTLEVTIQMTVSPYRPPPSTYSCVRVPSQQIEFSVYWENMTIRLEEKIVLFHEKQRKQRNIISADRIFLCLCLFIFIFSFFFLNLRISKPFKKIHQEIGRERYVAAVVDVKVITTKICDKVNIFYLRDWYNLDIYRDFVPMKKQWRKWCRM